MQTELAVPESERELCDLLRDLAGVPASTEAGGAVAAGPVVTGSAAPEPAAVRAGFGGSCPDLEGAGSVVISTSRLADVVSFRPRDLTIEVGAGTRMKDLVQFVQEQNLWLPASGPGLERSVGGWISASSPDAWDACFGPVRRQLLGCRMATPSGQLLSWGRAVMKNVAGYDMPRLMAGSRGRLGIMTTITLRLWPRPPVISAHEIAGSEPGDLLEWTGADAVAWQWSRQSRERQTVVFAGGAESVHRRRNALGDRAGSNAHGVVSVWPPRTAESVVYRLTPGRRYLPATFAALTRTAEPSLAAIEAWPATGTMLVQFDAGQQPDLPRPEMITAVERGGPGTHERVTALRDPAISSIERKIERVFGAWPRSWLADYL